MKPNAFLDFGFPPKCPDISPQCTTEAGQPGECSQCWPGAGPTHIRALVTTAVSRGRHWSHRDIIPTDTLWAVEKSDQRAGEWNTGDGICRRLVLSNQWRVHAAANTLWHQQKPSHENQTQSEGERVLSAQTQTLPQLSTSSKKQQQEKCGL